MTTGVFFALAGMLIALPCCVLVPRMLARGGYLDMPTARSSHVRPTPKGGGVGMALAFCVLCCWENIPVALWLPMPALAALSFANDLHGISPKTRLLAQTLAALVCLAGAQLYGILSWPVWIFPLAVFFLVGTANCFNFMDGINGIAGICGMVALGLLSAFHLATGIPWIFRGPTLAVLGALAVFLPFNLPRAKLFMGDVGSIFLGFFFAFSACMAATSWTDVLVMTAFLFPFYADEAASIIERIQQRKSLLLPHRQHLYQFLANELGVAHWKVSLLYGGIQLIFALAIWAISRYGFWTVLGTELLAAIAWIFGHFAIKKRHTPSL